VVEQIGDSVNPLQAGSAVTVLHEAPSKSVSALHLLPRPSSTSSVLLHYRTFKHPSEIWSDIVTPMWDMVTPIWGMVAPIWDMAWVMQIQQGRSSNHFEDAVKNEVVTQDKRDWWLIVFHPYGSCLLADIIWTQEAKRGTTEEVTQISPPQGTFSMREISWHNELATKPGWWSSWVV